MKKGVDYMKRTVYLALSICCFLMAGLCLFSMKRSSDEALASRIAPEILRFHVLANSDQAADQQLKIAVSYTHLDVYKRQSLACATMKLSSSSAVR